MQRYLPSAVAALGAIFWLYTISVGLSVKDQLRSDGLQWMSAFFATPGFVIANIPAIILCFTRFQGAALFAGLAALTLYAAPYLVTAIAVL